MAQAKRAGLIAATGPGLALQELLYGFIMELIFVTAARIGMLDYGDAVGLCILIVGMNFTWGAIDAVIFYIINLMGARKNAAMIDLGKNGGKDREAAIDYLMDEFAGTPMDSLTPEEERRICGLVVECQTEDEEGLARDRRDMRASSVGCFVITCLTVIPVIVPILLLEPLSLGLDVASALCSTILFFVGYMLKDYLSVNGWAMGLFLAGVSWAITIIATFTGGRRARARTPTPLIPRPP